LKIGSRKEGGFFYEVSSRTVIQLEDIKSMLSSEKWSITEEDNHLVAKKGKAGFWGSLLFHLGLLIVFIAGVISSLTRFNAELLLTEGFPVMLREESFVKIYKNNSILSIPPSIIELKKFIPLYEKGIYAKDFSAKISIDGVERELRVNRPIDIGGFQLSLHRFGFSPYFRITENNGKELLNANINLVVIGGKEDSFTIPDTFYVIYTKFFPDFFSKNGRVGSRGIVPKNPVFFLRIFYDNKELGRGMVKLGSTITIDELNISFKDLNYWVDLIVSKDYGVWLFSIGLAIGIFGLIMRFILPDKQLKINVVGNRVYIKGWTKYFPSFFEDEINKVLEKISN
jgi:cytochrome c biogenesis protein ResB